MMCKLGTNKHTLLACAQAAAGVPTSGCASDKRISPVFSKLFFSSSLLAESRLVPTAASCSDISCNHEFSALWSSVCSKCRPSPRSMVRTLPDMYIALKLVTFLHDSTCSEQRVAPWAWASRVQLSVHQKQPGKEHRALIEQPRNRLFFNMRPWHPLEGLF